ncbi:MAG: tRNA (cytidine(34)-2'-O)-methyltransferase [Chlamydiales bacterium]|nr:tRNA (cytidine(34)-2'-O)-methyltransferase [Chlamydiales bacterium]
MKIVLFRPQIPQNAGNIVRTCKITGADLIFVRPLGFSTSDRWLKRAGLDYWDGVSVEFIDNLTEYIESLEKDNTPFYFFSSKAKQRYTDIAYSKNAHLIFGSETSGLPQECHEKWAPHFVSLPMKEGRSLNLANSVAIGLYEAWRQQDFL